MRAVCAGTTRRGREHHLPSRPAPTRLPLTGSPLFRIGGAHRRPRRRPASPGCARPWTRSPPRRTSTSTCSSSSPRAVDLRALPLLRSAPLQWGGLRGAQGLEPQWACARDRGRVVIKPFFVARDSPEEIAFRPRAPRRDLRDRSPAAPAHRCRCSRRPRRRGAGSVAADRVRARALDHVDSGRSRCGEQARVRPR